VPTYQPTPLPTYKPTPQPTHLPTPQPTPLPTYQPTPQPIYESRSFNGGQHTWYLLNSEIRRIGEAFAQAPDKFELVGFDISGAFCRIYALDHFEARIVRDIAAAMRWTSPRKETYHHITNTMRCGQGGGSHWVAVVLEIEKTERPEATAAAAGTAVQQYETPHVHSSTKPDAPVKDAPRDSLSQELFASSSSSSSSSFSISTATEVAAMASYISMSVVATIASWLPTVLEVARLAYIAQRNSWDSLWLNELPVRATPEFQFKERFLVS
jgi:hypothetical protein